MYTNQYIIVSRDYKLKNMSLKSVEFDKFCIYAHSKLNVTIVNRAMVKIALIGYIINPFSPDDTNEEIIGKLADKCSTVNEFFNEIDILSGRYILLFKNDTSFIIAGDACHLRQIYYGFLEDTIVLTSSPKLFLDAFNYKLRISKEKLEFINNPNYLKQESIWLGDESIDNRLEKLLPNHYLDVESRVKQRIPFFQHNFSNEEQILGYVSVILTNTFTSLVKRHNVMQALTAGLDSRVLLAASRSVKDKIQYYVFDESSGKAPDAWVPGNLSRKLNFDFQILQPGELRTDFISEFNKEHVIPRILKKTAHIQYHYDCKYGSDVINVNGNGAEIVRCYYGYTGRKISFDILFTFAASLNHTKIPFFKEQLEKWYPDASQYAKDHGIPLLDLFYWEHKLGNWHALWQCEQDIALEEISPFNNRSLLSAFFEIHPKKRRSPDYTFFGELSKYLWEDVLSEPINPGGIFIKKLLKGRTMMRYIVSKGKSIFY